jgi:ABC-2 type transport system ATP-binding protein
MNEIIHVERLSKTFQVRIPPRGRLAALRSLFSRQSRLVNAVDAVSFTVRPGELVGYLGPNGAGKSTTLKMLCGLLVPSAGELRVDGMVPWRQRGEYVRNIGAVFGQRTTLWWDLPVIESLELLGYLYKVPEHRFRHNLNEFRNLLGLNEFLHTPARALSLGQRMRCCTSPRWSSSTSPPSGWTWSPKSASASSSATPTNSAAQPSSSPRMTCAMLKGYAKEC